MKNRAEKVCAMRELCTFSYAILSHFSAVNNCTKNNKKPRNHAVFGVFSDAAKRKKYRNRTGLKTA